MNRNCTKTYRKIGRLYNLSMFITKLQNIIQEKITALTYFFYKIELRNFNKTHHNTADVTLCPLIHW